MSPQGGRDRTVAGRHRIRGGRSRVAAYLAPALWIFWLAARGQLDSLGLRTPVSLRAVVTGALAGAGLSIHLLVSASRTLGVQVHVDHASEILSPIAYDVGANVLAAECFFRGALFNRATRRWSFATAATVATAVYAICRSARRRAPSW